MSKEEIGGYVCCGICAFLTFGILFGVLPFVIFTTQDTEIAVLYSSMFAEFQEDTVDTGGIHGKPYAATVFLWPRVETNVEFGDIVCNSADGLLIDMEISFQYVPDISALVDLTRIFGSFEDWEALMKIQAESAIRHTCGEFGADDYQNNRAIVAGAMQDAVKNSTETNFRAIVTKLQLKQIQRPLEFEDAVRDKENARSEISLAENEEAQALTQAQTKVDVAKQEEARILDTANTTAEILTSKGQDSADAILDRFEQFGNVFGGVKTSSQLTVRGILTYISNEIFNTDVTIAVQAPVQLDFKEDL